MLRAACFDLWGTLVVDEPGQGEQRAEARVRRLTEALRLSQWPAPPEAVAAAVQATIDSLDDVHQENRDLEADEREALFFRHLDPSLRPERNLAPEGAAAVRAAIVESALYSRPQLAAGAVELLGSLRARGLRLALVSNTGFSPGSALRELLADLGIAGFFTAQVYSDELRAWKPAPAMFDEAVFSLGVAAGESIFVGDTPESDILGAQSFGFRLTAQIGDKAVEGIQPSFSVGGLQELIAMLERRGELEPR